MNKLIFLFLSVLVETSFGLEVHGHRGARGSRPENTLPAFQFAMDAGVDALEMDTVVTRDNEVVVTHDLLLNPELCRTRNGDSISSQIAVRRLTLKELNGYDCSSKKNPKFPEQVPIENVQIPRLKDVLELVKKSKKNVRLNIETKIDPSSPDLSPSPEEFVRLLHGTIKGSGLENRIILQSFDPRTLQAAIKLKLPYERSLLLQDRPKPPLEEAAKMFSASIVSPDFHWINAEDVRRLHSAGVKIIPWTVNEKADWKKMMNLGVDGLITDKPKELIAFLKQPSQ